MNKSDPPPRASRLAFFEQNSDVDLIAHRGGNGQWPGETTYAFTRALQSGADVIEMDVWGTADDPTVLVLMHSSDISKVTEGSGKVSSLHIPYTPPAEALQMAERLPVIRFWLLSRGFIR